MKDQAIAENRIRTKLRSKRGASITFALLLFLVCAALSAVVLVAATTAAGRISNIAETDQRYYSVTSAAELLRDSLDNNMVSMVKMKSGEYIYLYKAMDKVTNGDIGIDEDEITLDEGEEPGGGTTGGGASLNGIARAFAESYADEGSTGTAKLSLSSNLSGDPLNVTIDQTRNAAGDITMTIYNSSGRKYKMQLVFATEVKEANPPVTKLEGHEVADRGSREISWHLIKVVSAYDARITDIED